MSIRRSLIALPLLLAGLCPAQAVQVKAVDGPFLSVDGAPAQLLGVHMPSALSPHCAKEEALGRAANALIERLAAEPTVSVTPKGPNKQRNALYVLVIANGSDIRKALFAARLAFPWNGGDMVPNWCGDLDGPYVHR